MYEKKGDRWGTDVDFSGPEDGWIAGLDYGDDGAYGTPFFTRWDGEKWSEVDPGELADHEQLGADSISALAPDDAWATYPSTESGKSYGRAHWDGAAWTYSEGPKVEAASWRTAPRPSRSVTSSGSLARSTTRTSPGHGRSWTAWSTGRGSGCGSRTS